MFPTVDAVPPLKNILLMAKFIRFYSFSRPNTRRSRSSVINLAKWLQPLPSHNTDNQGPVPVVQSIKAAGYPGLDNLISILGIEESHARLILKKHGAFNHTPLENLSSSLTYLTESNVPLKRILHNPWLLLVTPKLLDKQIKTVMSLLPVEDVQVAVTFVAFPTRKLMQIGFLWKSEASKERVLVLGKFISRLHYLSHRLECSDVEVADCMVKVKQLTTLPFIKIDSVLNTLVDGGVNVEDIKLDPWIFLHNWNVMKTRLEEAACRKLPKLKPWVLRCSPSNYESYMQRTLEEYKLMERDENIEAYLQRRLNWSPYCVQEILNRAPCIRTIKVSKLERMISFLLSKGFTSHDIATTPRILHYSVATLAMKLAELSELSEGGSYPLQSLSMLCQNSKKYDKFLKMLRAKRVPVPGSDQRYEGVGPK